ncbi:hypothetical protein JVU11DRAFT_5215 [Chiua virens]|nr:hypothetical protein JVU11DRAFT_5215 [Chiua virens]
MSTFNFCPSNSDLVDDLVDPSHYAYSFLDNPYLQRHARPPTPIPSFPHLGYPPTRRSVSTPNTGLDYYPAASQPLFPTPSELLSDINQRHQPDVPGSDSRSYLPSPPPPQTSKHQSPVDITMPSNTVVNKTESQRKARQRAIAEEIGFTPTDPDTISSHEKKRHYLECLEQYVLYLHEQLRLVQTAPLALERVSTYRGLSSRSIRTLLVHMQSTNKTLHEGTLVEEQVFLDLSSQVMDAHNVGLPLRRHSVDVVGVSRNSGYNPSLTPFDPMSSLPPDDMTASASPSSADACSASPDPSTDLTTPRFLFPSTGDGM